MRARISAFVVVFALAATAFAAAQETTGTISGRIIDSQGLPVPGVAVTATGPQGAKTVVTDADGRYSVPFLTPGSYSVRAELQGFRPAQVSSVNVSLGQMATANMTMQVGAVTEQVQVTATAPAIDTRTTTTGAVLDSELFNQIPVGRRMSDTLYMAPGVGSSGTAGQANPSIAGGTGLDNQYVIDGVNVTSAGYGGLGSYSIEFGSLGNATPFDFIKEVQVKTGGYEAEYGQALGGVVNVVTKSGSNALHGSAFSYFRPAKTEGDWTQFQSSDFTTVQTLGSRSYDAGVEGGGPIVKDKLFFFGAIDPTWDFTAFEAPAGRPLASLGSVDRERRNINYAAKATWQLGSGHRVDASFFGDPSKGFNGPQRPSALIASDTSAYSALNYGGHNQTVRYDGILTSKWLLDANWGRAVNNVEEIPSVNQYAITDRTVTPLVRSGGVGFFEGGNNSVDNQLSLKATNFVGAHQIKFGAEYDHIDYTQSTQYSGPTFVAPNGQRTFSGASVTIYPDPVFGRIFRVTRAKLTPPVGTVQNYFDVFVQDSWTIGNRLTINPGIRYEQERQQGSVETLSLKNNWSPRIGATYDVFGDSKTKLYASWGRFFARLPNDLAARALSVDNLISIADYFDANLTQPIPEGVPTSKGANHFVPGASSADDIDPNIKMSYTDEWALGVERQLWSNMTVGVRYMHNSIGRAIEDVQTAPIIPYTAGDPAVSYNYFLTNPSHLTPVTPAVPGFNISFPDISHRYDAVEFTAERRFSQNWSLMSSYRWSRLRGNYEGFYNNLIGQSDPGITAGFDFPYNDPSATSAAARALDIPGNISFLGDPNGILTLDQPHAFKLFGNYTTRGLNVGIGFTAQSGLPLTPMAFNPAYGENDIPTAPMGSGIQTIDGFKTRTPFRTQTNAQVSYAIKTAGGQHLTLLADVLNLFNQQTVQLYDYFTQQAVATPNPDFGEPVTQIPGLSTPQFQMPRQIRFGLRYEF